MFGFLRVAAAVPKIRVADIDYNLAEIKKSILLAEEQKAEILLFPELSISGYSCGDLFFQPLLIKKAESAVAELAKFLKDKTMLVVIGAPISIEGALYNTAVFLHGGKILAVIPKTHLPNYGEFYEKRHFSPAKEQTRSEISFAGVTVPFGTDILIRDKARNLCLACDICEDIWVPNPPSTAAALSGANIILNLSASSETAGKARLRREMIAGVSKRLKAVYVYTSCGMHESTSDFVFGGHAMVYEAGELLAESEILQQESQLITTDVDLERMYILRKQNPGFDHDYKEINAFRRIEIELFHDLKEPLQRKIPKNPFLPKNPTDETGFLKDAFAIQRMALVKRLLHIGKPKAIIAVSGGLDSTLALLVTAAAFDEMGLPRKEVIGITMPGFGTSEGTLTNANELMRELRISTKEISIEAACLQHFKDINHPKDLHDVTFENAQARERTQIAMDIANMEGGIMIGPADLSELVLGFTTYNGDHMSMYGVNSGVPKTMVREIVSWVDENLNLLSKETEVLEKILKTPISPELLPLAETGEMKQITEDLMGPYELNDFFIYYILGQKFSPKKVHFIAAEAFGEIYSRAEIKAWLILFYKRFFASQFKRSCMPDGPKVFDISVSTRGDLRIPSDAVADIWLKEAEDI